MVKGAREIQEHFRMADGFDLFCRHWKVVGEAERVVVCIHGIGGHSGVFSFLGHDLAEEGIEVYALDLRGFGDSKEEAFPRGDTSDFNRHLQDVKEAVDLVRKRHPRKKVYMFGYSLGVLYVLWCAANYPESLDGIVLAAPYWVGLMPQTYVANIPRMLMSAPGEVYDSSETWSDDFRESEEGKILLQDPLFTAKRSWRWLGGIKETLSDRALLHASRIEKPVLIILGEKDDAEIHKGARELLASLAAKDKLIQTFPDADHFFYHALFFKTTAKHDPTKRKQVTSVVKNWSSTH